MSLQFFYKQYNFSSLTIINLSIVNQQTVKFSYSIMDKSFINEIYALCNSTSSLARVSSYTSLPSDNDNGLRKSRIIKLPNYNPIDLSDKKQWVTVFQAIQIERLSTEVQSLRLNNKDLERKLTNFQNYEVQIRQLTQKCLYYQSERQYHRLQMNRIIHDNQILSINHIRTPHALTQRRQEAVDKRCLQLVQQVEKWKIKYNALEISSKKQRQQARKSTQQLRKSFVVSNNSENKNGVIKLELEKISLQNQIKKLRQKGQNKDIEIERLNTQIARMDIEMCQMKSSNFGIAEYESKIAMLNNETLRLNDLLKFRNQQIAKLNEQQKYLLEKIKHNNHISPDYIEISGRLQARQKQFHQLHVRYSQLVERVNKEQIDKSRAQENQRLLDKTDCQLSKVNQILQEKIKQCERWRDKYIVAQAQVRQFKHKKSNSCYYSNGVSTRNSYNSYELSRQSLQAKENQIDDLRAKCYDLDRMIQNFKVIEKQKKSVEQQLIYQSRVTEDYQKKIRYLQEATSHTHQLQNQLKDWQSKKMEFNLQIQRLNSNLQIKIRQAENHTKKIFYLQQELHKYKTIEIELNQQRKKSHYLTHEIDRIHGLLVQKEKQFNILKEKIFNVQFSSNRSKEFDSQFKMYAEQIQKLISKLNEAHKQSFFYQEKALQAEAQFGKASSQIDNFLHEQQRITTVLNQKNAELELLKQQCAILQKQMKELRQHYHNQRKNMEQSNIQNVRKVQKRLRQQSIRCEDLNRTSNLLRFEVDKLKNEGSFPQDFINEYKHLKVVCQMKQREINQIYLKFQKAQRLLQILRGHVEKQNRTLIINHQNWNLIAQRYKTFAQFTQHMINDYDKATQVYVQNISLQSQTRLKNFELQQSHILSRSLIGDHSHCVDPQTTSMKSFVSMLKLKDNLSSTTMTKSDIYTKMI